MKINLVNNKVIIADGKGNEVTLTRTEAKLISEKILDDRLNDYLFETRQEVLLDKVIKLQRKIESFKSYDEKRIAYYKKSIQKLGELESYVAELEDTINSLKDGTLVDKLVKENTEKKKIIASLNKKLQATELTPEEISSVENVASYKLQIRNLAAKVKKLEKDKLDLFQQIVKLRNAPSNSSTVSENSMETN